MDEAGRDAFLARFTTMGRASDSPCWAARFSEGIDLVERTADRRVHRDARLAADERRQRADAPHAEAKFGSGYDYTYLYPGLQKVVQAAGRVIRTEDDAGVRASDRRPLSARGRAAVVAALVAGRLGGVRRVMRSPARIREGAPVRVYFAESGQFAAQCGDIDRLRQQPRARNRIADIGGIANSPTPAHADFRLNAPQRTRQFAA